MKVVLTGAAGFMGWHTRLRLRALTGFEVTTITRNTWHTLTQAVNDADSIIHVAGVNRGVGNDVLEGNIRMAQDVAKAARQSRSLARIIYANSIQDGNGTPYGTGKSAAREVLQLLAKETGIHFVDVRLPNLFGEHGRPRYNSFVATFVAAVRNGESPQIVDRPVGLLHVQGAAQSLIDGLATEQPRIDPSATEVTVQGVYELLQEFHGCYGSGEFPDLSTPFRVDLFNTYRAALFPSRYPISLTPHTDARGTFVETVRARGGEGQTSFSSTHPGVTRGEHYHLRKIERFAVIAGTARISLRRMFSNEVIDFHVSGDEPSAIDMPTGWVHNITNTGDELLLTQFWSHELHRPEAPDTFHEPVRRGTEASAT